MFKLLKSAYVDARYNTKCTVSNEELEILGGRVQELHARVERVCSGRIRELGEPTREA